MAFLNNDNSNIYLRPRVMAIFSLGVASGFPYAMVAATLTQWLSEEGVSRGSIGLFTLVLLSYSFKPFWAWILDAVRLPVLTKILGHRRSWLLVADGLLVLALALLSQTNPVGNLELTAYMAIAVAVASATQDIVIDAYRIEILDEEEQGAGAAMVSYGWRTGAFLASTLALLLAEYVGWSFAYSVMGAMVAFALVPAFFLGEPLRHKVAEKSDLLKDAIAPFKEFLTRHGAFIILAFVLLHKIGDTMANLMLRNLLVELEFTKPEVAFYDVAVGQVALFIGIAVGGFLYARWGVAKSMLLSLVLMMISNLSFAVLAMIGHDVHFLAFTIGFENFASGVGGVIVVGYLSGLCNLAYTATQYALLSGAAAITGRFLTAPSGYLIDWVGFPVFYLITTAAAVPGIILFIFMIRNGFLGLEKPETAPKST